MAEIILAAGIEAQVLAHLAALCFEKTDQPATMVVMAVAHDKRVDCARVDFQIIEIIRISVGRVAEIQKIAPRLAAFLQFDMQRQTPLAV